MKQAGTTDKHASSNTTPSKSEASQLTDHIADRICRLADAMIMLSAQSIKSQWGIRHNDLRIMNLLDAEEPLSVREISRRVYIDQAWVSRSLKQLQEKNLVKRAKDANDSRLTLISLTDHGREVLDQVRPYALYSEKHLLKGIDEKKLKKQLSVLDRNASEMLDMLKTMDLDPERLKHFSNHNREYDN